MFYFSKLKLTLIYSTIFILVFFALLNIADINKNFLASKKVNLGLDLQGGSYLLLELDTKPIETQKLQNKLIDIRKILKNFNSKYSNLKISNNKILFNSSQENLEKFINLFLNKENSINNYY